MKTVDIFYQADGLRVIDHTEAAASQKFSDIKKMLAKKLGFEGDVLLFLEDEDEPVDDNLEIGVKAGRAGIKAHIHRCRQIQVLIHFNGKTVRHKFPPSATVTRVKKWVAEKEFGMTAEEASHHHLQITGTTNQPAPGTHIGTLSGCPQCTVEFDLVTIPKVNG